MRLVAMVLVLFAYTVQRPEPNRGTRQSGINERQRSQKTSQEKSSPTERPQPQIIVDGLNVEEPSGLHQQDHAYDASKDALYRWYLRFAIAGVFVALVGIVLLIFQTIATKKAADAALLQVKHVIKSERPWILVENVQLSELLPMEHQQPIQVSYEVNNYGRTPARIVRARTRLQMSDDNSHPPNPEIYDVGGVIPQIGRAHV